MKEWKQFESMEKFWRKWLNMLVVNTHWSVVGSCQAAVGRSMAYEQPGIKDRAVKDFSSRLRNSLHFFRNCGEVAKNI